MWSFEGDYRKKPKQSLSGKSRPIERQALLSRLRRDREQRENYRLRHESATHIQSWMRGNWCREKIRQDLRVNYDAILLHSKNEVLEKERVEMAIFYIIKIFDSSKDCDRLLSLCQYLIQDQKRVIDWICISFVRWKYLLPRLLSLALQIISLPPQQDIKKSHTYLNVPIRLLEVLSYPGEGQSRCLDNEQKLDYLCSLFKYVIKVGYYKHLIQILLKKVPEIYESSPNPPTPFALSILKLIIHPLQLFSNIKDGKTQFGALINAEFCREILLRSNCSQLHNFVLPHLASNDIIIGEYKYSLLEYIYCSIDSIILRDDIHYLLYGLLIILPSDKELLGSLSPTHFLRIAGAIVERRIQLNHIDSKEFEDEGDYDDDFDDSDMDVDDVYLKNDNIFQLCLTELNSPNRVAWILSLVERNIESEVVLISFSKLFHSVLYAHKYQLHQCQLLYSVVLRRNLLKPMWTLLSELRDFNYMGEQNGDNSENPRLIQMLSVGYILSTKGRAMLIPILSSFCASLIAVMATLHDSELLNEGSEPGLIRKDIRPFPFAISEIIQMSAILRDVCVGLVELAHPDGRKAHYMEDGSRQIMTHCLEMCVGAVRQIYLRDTRHRFCPENHWHNSRIHLSEQNGKSFSFMKNFRRTRSLFQPQKWLTKEHMDSESPRLPMSEQRRVTLLQKIPFVFPFKSRMAIFKSLISNDKEQYQATADYGVGPGISIVIRRTHLYEDGFEKLSLANEKNLRLKTRVHLLNTVGLDEAGIDGGGIFREFLSELLKTCFDPNRGFFLLTRDNTLYPNPAAHLIAENFEQHYYFIGRMIGKALYENLLVEIPLAGFFLTKLLNSVASSSVEFQYLDSLDPDLCRNLLSLKNMDTDISELGLDFTTLSAQLGQNNIIELLPNGANIPVTNENCIEYIYRMADYKLNKQIAKQSRAFKEGVYDVINAQWLRLFDWRELQMLISGASTPIDVVGLKSSTRYAGSYGDAHPTIGIFWSVVENFNEVQKRDLLKFVTSCSRPPLLGFKELYPAFCIQPSGSEERLPTASTCMNLLKLPEYKDRHTLKEKLLYAITSASGFELS